MLERPGTGEQSRDSAVQSQKVDSRKGQVGTALSKPAFSAGTPPPKGAGGLGTSCCPRVHQGASVRAESGGWVWGEWTQNPEV